MRGVIFKEVIMKTASMFLYAGFMLLWLWAAGEAASRGELNFCFLCVGVGVINYTFLLKEMK